MLLGLTPLGTSAAAAVVTTCLFFGALVGALANLVYTKYPFYDVLMVSSAFRCVAYGARAAYLTHYRPALGGVFLAFSNAGYGANVAALYVVQASWCWNTVLTSISAREFKFWRSATVALVVQMIVAFGPILGVIAAGYLYGDLTPHGQAVGLRLRAIACWGLWGCTFAFSLINARFFLASLTTSGARKTADEAAAGTGAGGVAPLTAQRERQQRMIGVLFPASLLLQVRAVFNVVLLYPAYLPLAADQYWYPLSVLPELLVMYLLVTPTLYARVALAWPRQLKQQGATPAVGRIKGSDSRDDAAVEVV